MIFTRDIRESGETERRIDRGERATLAIAAGFILLRCIYLAFPDLYPEEAYYWNYAKHLDIGYLDHPPMVAWLIHLGTAVFGDSEFGVRIFALVSSLVAGFFVYRLTALLYDRRIAATALLLQQVLPFFFMTGFMTTPDAPLAACWAGALYFLARVIFDRSATAWLGVGACLGLGMLSKYTIALLGPAALLFLLLDKPSRVWFRRPAPYGAALLAAVIFSPVIIWNVEHQWASFAFQSTNRVSEARVFMTHQLLASILCLLTPVGVILACQALAGRGVARDDAEAGETTARRRLFVRVFALVPLSVFVIFSVVHKVKLNWTGPLWLATVPTMAALVVALDARPDSILRRAWVLTVGIMLLSFGLVLQYLTTGLPGLGYASAIELLPVGWSELGRELERKKTDLKKAAGGRVLIVGLDRNFIASEAAFYQSDRSESVRETTGVHLFGGNSLMYQFWFPAKDQDGADLLLVSFKRGDLDRRLVHKRSGSLGPIEENSLRRGGKDIRPYYTRVVSGYQPGGAGR